MRTLVLQLARFGDIYQSWPAIKALVRRGDEVHVVVRERFKDALLGLEGITVHSMPSADILAPLVNDGDVDASSSAMLAFAEGLKALDFNLVVNLSFSPFSSYLTEFVSGEATEARGYTRFPDGYLRIPDDSSAYFYAQAQTGGANRFHITEVFASVAGIELKPEDYSGLQGPSPREKRVIVHLGASEARRVYPGELWIEALKAAIPASGADWVLVGAESEIRLAETVVSGVGHARLSSRLGKTTLPELMQLIASSALVVGSDSAPSQIASLTATPVLHLTSDASNFWTTGPTSPGSRILYAANLYDIPAKRIAEEVEGIIRGLEPRGPCVLRASVSGSYTLHDLEFDSFGWDLIQALYVDGAYPETESNTDLIAFQRLFELGEAALHNISLLKNEKARAAAVASENLASIDQLISEVGKLNPRVNPLVQWFETQRLRIPPGSFDETIEASRALFADLQLISSVYRRFTDPRAEEQKASQLCAQLAPRLREYEFNSVQSEFHDLVSVLHELSRHSTKVGGRAWSSVLTDLNAALEQRDFIELADQLEYVLVPALS